MRVRGTKSEKGFTLPELLVVGGFLVIFVIVSVALIRPRDYGPERRNAERTVEVIQLTTAFKKYIAEHGAVPEEIITEPRLLGSEGEKEKMIDMCEYLVPHFLKDLPLDPQAGGTAHEKVCDPEDPLYVLGYTVHVTKNSELVVEAPAAEDGEKISQTLKFQLSEAAQGH